MSSSIGMMKFPIYGKIKNVPNHQPDFEHVLPCPGLGKGQPGTNVGGFLESGYPKMDGFKRNIKKG